MSVIFLQVCFVDPTDLGVEAVSTAAAQPLSQVGQYLSCLCSMAAAGRRQKSLRVLRMCDLLEKAAASLKAAEKTVERQRRIVEETRNFWELHGSRYVS